MWCANCQTDVATEISTDGQSLQCVTCNHEIRRVFAPSLHPETQSARELLERWARENQDSSTRSTGAAGSSAAATPKDASQPSSHDKGTENAAAGNTGDPSSALPPRRGMPEKPFRPPVKVRIDPAHDTFGAKPIPQAGTPETPAAQPPALSAPAVAPATPAVTIVPAPSAAFTKANSAATAATSAAPMAAGTTPPSPPVTEQAAPGSSRPNLRVDAAHTAPVPSPHVDVRPFATRPGARPGRAESLWGQLLAYTGVGGITVGTVFVVWGYFGGIEHYASTGWLVATAGQMMLLLGVVTLISGGMQQTTHEVGARIETLDGRIHRIEQSTHQLLKGPHFARKRRKGERRSQQPPAA